MTSIEDVEDWILLSDKSKRRLNKRRQKVIAKRHEKFAKWCLEKGKYPEDGIGLSEGCTKNYLKRIDRIKREIWESEGEYTRIDPEVADEYIENLKNDEITKSSGEEYGRSSKRKLANTLEKYLRWKRDEDSWECKVNFREGSGKSKEAFSKEERKLLREASIDYKTLPGYNNVTPEKRDRLKRLLAQRIGKPKEEIVPEDWERQNTSFKIPSLVHTSLDIGPRPELISRFKVDWLRLEENKIVIPKKDAVKSQKSWEASIKQETSEFLEEWIKERESRPKYDDTNLLWLTREGNPYSSGSLNYLLDNLCEEAGIDTEDRDISWYSIRHSVGEMMTRKGGIEEAKEQLRHNSIESTLVYTNPTPEERRDTLRRMG